MGEAGIQPDLVQIEQSGVLLLQLQRGLFPGLHLLQFAPKLLILLMDARVALKIPKDVQGPVHRRHSPVE